MSDSDDRPDRDKRDAYADPTPDHYPGTLTANDRGGIPDEDLRSNADFDTGLRLALAAQLGHSGFDDRDRYDVFGWETDPDEDEYVALYLRNPYARAVVDRPATTTWRHAPAVVDDAGAEGETEFEEAVAKLERAHDLSSYCERVDRLAGVGEYALLFVDFDDATDLDDLVEPYEPEDPDLDSIRGFRVYAQAQIENVEYGEFGDDRWGSPVRYDVDLTEDIDDDADEDGYAKIHHTRAVQVPSTQLLDDEDKARPRLEPVLNPLYDIEKTLGAVAEAAYRGADYGLHLNADPTQVNDNNLSGNDDLATELQRYEQDLQRYIRTSGIDIERLGGEVQDPSGIIDAELSAIAAQTGIPKRILSGDAAGELSASEEDTRRWYARARERQNQYAAPLNWEAALQLLIDHSVLPDPRSGTFETVWPELFEPTEAEIADRQQSRSTVVRNLQTAVPDLRGERAETYVETGEFPDREDTPAGNRRLDESDPRVQETFDRATGNATRYSEGDVVQTPQGVGVVVEVRTEPFEGKGEEVNATSSSPMYIIGLKDARVGVGFYKASQLSADEIETDVDNPIADLRSEAVSANAALEVVERVNGYPITANDWTMPRSWRESDTPARLILLKAWASMGAQFDCGGSCCMGELKSERLCAAMKDEVLGGWGGWRKGG